MERILIYADTHIGTVDTLKELEIKPDYALCDKFIEIVKKQPHILVVCLGDFIESIWDSMQELQLVHSCVMNRLKEVTDIFLVGNHDPYNGRNYYKYKEFTFLHGHQWERASNGYIERLHEKARGGVGFMIIAHTHSPILGEGFMDVGSLTLNGTYGEIIRETPYLRRL